jgi:hypothetical protein
MLAGPEAGSSDAVRQFDLAINDRDRGTRRESQMIWSGTDRDTMGS